MRKNSQDAIREFRPYFDNAPVYGGSMSLEDYMDMTPMTIGSPQQVIDRTLAFREVVGDYQRQLFLADHAGLPLDTVLEQLDILGSEVVPVLRREFEAMRPADVPSDPPLHPRVAGRARRGALRVPTPGEPVARRPEGARMTAPEAALAGRRRGRRQRAVVDPAAGRPHRRGRRAPPAVTPASSRASEVIELRPLAQDLASHVLAGFPPPALQAALDAVVARRRASWP